MIHHPAILEIKNFLKPEQVKAIKSEVRGLEDKFVSIDYNPDFTNQRIMLDSYRRQKHFVILDIFDNIWKDDKFMDKVTTEMDFAYQLMPWASVDETSIKIEMKNDKSTWHKNDARRKNGYLYLTSWMWYFKLDGDYIGGDIQFSYDKITSKDEWSPDKKPTTHITIKAEENTFVMFPGYLWHRISPLKFKHCKHLFEGRCAIVGHVGFETRHPWQKLGK